MENKFINITLPDGTVLNKPIGTTGYDIAYGISESLANHSIAVEIDNEFKDLSYPIQNDCSLKSSTRIISWHTGNYRSSN